MLDPRGGAVRSRMVTGGTVGLMVLMVVVPPLVVGRPFAQSAVLLVPGLTTVFGWALLMQSKTGRYSDREVDGDWLTVRTWTGPRSINLVSLTRVHCWVMYSRNGHRTVMFSLADTFGNHVYFDEAFSRIVRAAIEETRAQRGVHSVQVSERSSSELGFESLPKSAALLGGVLLVLWVVVLFLCPVIAAAIIAQR